MTIQEWKENGQHTDRGVEVIINAFVISVLIALVVCVVEVLRG